MHYRLSLGHSGASRRKTALTLILIGMSGLVLGLCLKRSPATDPSRSVRFFAEDQVPRVSFFAPSEWQILVLTGGRTVEMDLETYVFYAVAAEMPASYPEEALKAQAVCARTLAVYKVYKQASHEGGAQVCADSGHCQAMADEAYLRETWGDTYDYYAQKVASAVEATRGMILLYNGTPAEIFYHASSNGLTEDAAEVFAYGRSYLTSVKSAEPVDVTRTELSLTEAASLLNAAFPKANVTGRNLSVQLEILSRTVSGRADRIRVGQTEVSGVSFRHALNLKSTDIVIAFTDTMVQFICRGYGHGVGMSQKGAEAMAEESSDYADILSHYYVGTKIGFAQDFMTKG